MDQRKKIGLLITESYQSSAGIVIYTMNMIRSLNLLEDRYKPVIYLIFRHSDFMADIEKIQYPYLESIDLNQFRDKRLHVKVLNKIGFTLFKKALVTPNDTVQLPEMDYIFSASSRISSVSNATYKVYWKPDLQEKYLTGFFSEAEYNSQETFLRKVASSESNMLVLSSQDVLNDFQYFYPTSKNKTFLLRFISFIPPLDGFSFETLAKRLAIRTSNYFVIANQFWPHKNHQIALLAALLLKKKGIDFQYVITGQPSSHRSKVYYPQLMRFCEEHNLKEHMIFTGFLEREEQLLLIKNARGVIQPSLFEGWSTVVEDSKALNKLMIVSDLKVLREQVTRNAYFFNPLNEHDLAAILEQIITQKQTAEPVDYTENIEQYKNDLIRLFSLAAQPKVQAIH